MPLIRRLPKRGFNNAAFRKDYAIVNLDDLNEFKAGTVVNEQLLRESNLVRGEISGIKILGDGELKHALKIEADKVSESAKAKIEKAGGTITMRDRAAEKPVADAEDVDQRAKKETRKKRSASKSRPSAKKKTSRK
jgi:ribosomal protein L18E